MNHIKSLLKQKVANTNAKMWHLLLLLTLVWIAPLLLPEAVWQDFTLYIIAAWILLYVALSRAMRTILRLTAHDAILIERFFVSLSFLAPFIYGIFYGLRHGFDPFLIVCLISGAIILALLVVSIVIHVKTSQKYYHGVDKDELFG